MQLGRSIRPPWKGKHPYAKAVGAAAGPGEGWGGCSRDGSVHRQAGPCGCRGFSLWEVPSVQKER